MNKKLRITFAFIFSLLFISCSNLFVNKKTNEPGKIVTVSGSFSAGDDFSRTAFPVLPSSDDFFYEIKASATIDGEKKTSTGSVDITTHTYNIDLLSNYEWTITLKCYKNFDVDVYSNPLFYGELLYDLTDGNVPESSSITLNKIESSAGSGSLSVPVKVDDNSYFTDLIVEWKLAEDTSWVSSNKKQISFSSDSITVSIPDLNPGIYNLRLKFCNNATVVSIINESFYIVNDYVTDSWGESSSLYIKSVDGKNVLYMTKELSKFFLSKYFYVDSTGSDSNAGTYYTPFASIQQAIDVIDMINDGTSKYYIYLLSDIACSSRTSFSTYGTSSIHISPINSLDLIISSYDASSKKTITAASDSRVIFVSNACKLSLNSLIITGGKESNGGGIFNKGELNLKNCEISSNTALAEDSRGSGGGIYSTGNLKIDGCSILSNTCDYQGAGILSTDSTITISNSIISKNNSSDSGGAIYHCFSTINNSVSFVMANTTIGGDSIYDGNYAKYHGGGIFITSTNATIKGCSISFNQTDTVVNCTGGGLWFTGQGCVLDFTSGKSGISNNVSYNGGGFLLKKGSFVFDDIDITYNSAENCGAGMYVYSNGKVTFTGETNIKNNIASVNPEDITGLGGGGILCKNATVESTEDSTMIFENNHSGLFGGAIYAEDAAVVDLHNVTSSSNTLGSNVVQINSVDYSPAGAFLGMYQSATTSTPKVTLNNCNITEPSAANYEIYQYSGNGLLTLNNCKLHNIYSIAPVYIEGDILNGISDGADGKVELTLPDSQSTSTTNKELAYYSDGVEVLKGSKVSSNYEKFELSNADFELDSDGKLVEKTLQTVASLKANGQKPVEGHTYSVSTKEELNYISSCVNDDSLSLENVTFKQLNDIDLQNESFTPIGSDSKYFKGTYDGNHFKITNFKNNSMITSKVGVFGYINGATICNLYVSGEINGTEFLGGICGEALDSTIHDCVSEVKISGSNNYIGGICGESFDSSIYNCINAGEVSSSGGTSAYIGGIIGKIKQTSGCYAYIVNCANFGTISGISYIGGISGAVDKATVFNIYNCGYLNGSSNVGQIAGENSSGIYESYFYNGPDCEKLFGNDAAVSDSTCLINLSVLSSSLNDGRSKISVPFLSSLNSWVYELAFNGTNFPVCTIEASGLSVSYSSIKVDGSIEELTGYPEANKTYSISTAEGLKKLSEISNADDYTNSFTNVTILLLSDIDLKGSALDTFEPIANKKINSIQRKFSGVFDGQGNSITGLYVSSTGDYTGLFGYLKDGTIKNLYVSGEVYGSNQTAGIVAYAMGTSSSHAVIDSCVSNVKVTGGSTYGVGGIVGYCVYYSDIINCINLGDVTGSSSVGGIVGNNSLSGGIIANCSNLGIITGSSNVGGIQGTGKISINFNNCFNAGTISCENSASCGSVTGNSFTSAVLSKNLYSLKNCCSYVFGTSITTSLFVTIVEEADLPTMKDNLNSYITSSDGLDDDSYSIYKEWKYKYTKNGINYPVPIEISSIFSDESSSASGNIIPLDSSYKSLSSYGADVPQNGDKVKISNSDDFLCLVNLCYSKVNGSAVTHDLEGVTIALDRDIDMSGIEYKAPGFNKQYFFKGTLEGNGCTISNLTISAPGTGCHGNGLIGNAGDGAVIRNINLENLTYDSSAIYTCGGIVGYVSGNVLVENCNVNLDLNSSQGRKGGIAGDVNSTGVLTVRNCITTGNLNGTGYIGGLVGGDSGGTVIIENCASYCDIIHTSGCSGGIVSQIKTSSSSINNCFFGGTITLSSISGQIGPISNSFPSDATSSNYSNLYYNDSFYKNGTYTLASGSLFSPYTVSSGNYLLKDTSDDIINNLNTWVQNKGSDYKEWNYDSGQLFFKK